MAKNRNVLKSLAILLSITLAATAMPVDVLAADGITDGAPTGSGMGNRQHLCTGRKCCRRVCR